MAVIELTKVNKIYQIPVKNHVLFDIDLEIQQGELCSIIGESGSGKTTLMNVMSTLDDASHGDIVIAGQNINDLNRDEIAELRNSTIGFIFQFHFLLPEFSVLENVLMPAKISGHLSNQATDRAKELLNFVGLSDIIDQPANMISGGQQQRTAIARALMNQSKIIFADEPTGNLDNETSQEVYKLFCKINRELDTTFLIVTHSKEIAQNADRIVRIDDGKIVEDISNERNDICKNE
jgi:lipoprotein-releasing system ATP-binding protein